MKKIYVIILLQLILTSLVYSQTENILVRCSRYITKDYISDGQQYSAVVKNAEPVSFQVTFFSGSVYRLATATDLDNVTLEFSVYDTEKNLLFNNKNYNYTPYWDFKFKSTIDCIIQIKLHHKKAFKPGLAMLLIGFKSK